MKRLAQLSHVSIHVHPCHSLQETIGNLQFLYLNIAFDIKTRPLFLEFNWWKKSLSFLKRQQIAWYSSSFKTNLSQLEGTKPYQKICIWLITISHSLMAPGPYFNVTLYVVSDKSIWLFVVIDSSLIKAIDDIYWTNSGLAWCWISILKLVDVSPVFSLPTWTTQ